MSSEALRQLVAGERDGLRLTKRYLRPDGSLVHAELSTSLLRGPEGSPLYFATQIIDVTEQQQTRIERDTHLTMLRSVLANSQSLIYVKDLQGRYLLANEPFERAFGVTETELLGHDDTWLDPALAPVWRANDLRAQQGEHRVAEWSEGPAGRQHYDSVKLPLYDGAGQLYATCGISLDVTEARRVAEALTQARDVALAATAAKSSFLATMSHEIRTPMNAVIGLTGLLLDSALDAQQRDLLETVRNSGDALLNIINDILDFSKIEAGELTLEKQPFSLRQCIESAVTLVALPAHDKHLELVADVHPGCPELLVGDVTRFRQVIVNLLGNAVKFTSAGEVMVTVTATPIPPSGRSATGPLVRLHVAVSDTGIGIPADRISSLFQSFSQVDTSTTREYGGTGLGLAISRRLAEAMSGDLAVVSEPGVGSTFTLCAEFPLVPELRAEVEGIDALSGRSAVVVDDNDSSRRVLQQHLQHWGMNVTGCAGPADVLALVAGGGAFDVAVLDMAMPGMDGPQLALALRGHPAGRDLPLVLLSALQARSESPDLAAFSAVVTKPVRAAALFDALAAALGSPEPGLRALESAGGHRAGDGPAVRVPAVLRVLLAEDNIVNQKVAQLMIRRLGHNVDTVSNGQEALDAVHRVRYDVVLMDVQMPVLDGLAATERIRAELPRERQPYILALTANALAEDRAACMSAGIDAFLPKPVRQSELDDALQAVRTDPHPASPEPAGARGGESAGRILPAGA
ncbi:MAG TPA: response regulator [Mycobacteriales bacterium]|nr:response regulator [Mycobacteriales bacterium]